MAEGHDMMQRRTAERSRFDVAFEFELGAAESGCVRQCSACGLDISSRGLGILTDIPLVARTILRLALPAYGAGTTLPVFAEVAWTYPVVGSFRTGLRFLQ